mmetsp:Transcript_31597/g.82458  ORF Transcript_31597/g.82458 Transcript_31597/m.82458 type:complete len:685 (-) Transcript_31597:53-2107(-)
MSKNRPDATEPSINVPNRAQLVGEREVGRYLGHLSPKTGLFGDYSAITIIEVEQWLRFAEINLIGRTLKELNSSGALKALNEHLSLRTFIVGYAPTLADYVAWSALKVSCDLRVGGKQFPHVHRWATFLSSQPELSATASAETSTSASDGKKRKDNPDESPDPTLHDAKEGQVCTRFPPEPSGFLHIGHAKAALLNNFYAKKYKGKLIVRFDDTNPTKEKVEFVDNILRDLKTLGVQHDVLSHTSDHFEDLLKRCEKMIKEGKAYVDDTVGEKMKEERMHGIDSVNRNNTVEKNLEMWKEMQEGTEHGLKCCVRAKINMQNPNKCMRDPVLYRCNLTPHHRTGSKYKVYPTYDFCCPIVDSVEGVTHALRTNEYSDRNDQYAWIAEAAGVRKPLIQDFSRLNFINTLLSKRKLQWFVDNGRVSGWDDPRFPTVQGMARRGLLIDALQEFILLQGHSKATNLMEWDKIWAINKKYIDPIAPRHTAIAADTKVPLTLNGAPSEVERKSALRHKKNESLGNKIVSYLNRVFIEQIDAAACAEGEEVTLMDWGNAIIRKIVKNAEGQVVEMQGDLHLEGSVKTTKKKLTWLADVEEVVECELVSFDYLITKPKLEEGDDFEDFLNPTTINKVKAVGDGNLRSLKQGDIIQLERRGFYVCDQIMRPGQPLVLNFIPDGKAKAASVLGAK